MYWLLKGVDEMKENMEEKKGDTASQIFKRGLFTCFCLYYFPLMFLMYFVVLSIDVLKQNIAITAPLLCFIFPAIFSVIMAFIRVRIVWGLEYKLNWKNQFLFLAIISLMLLIEKLTYSLLESPDFMGVMFFGFLLIVSLILYRSSKQKPNYVAVAKMLAVVSPIFVFGWFVFAVIVKAVYSIVVLLSWILLFCFSLRFVLKGGESN